MSKAEMTPEELEQQAFEAHLGGQDVESPLQGPPVRSPLDPEPELESSPEPAKFLGDFTEEEVLARLTDAGKIEERITQRLMGRFGEVGRDLKEIREQQTKGLQEWEFDPAVLDPLKEQDEGIHAALVGALTTGLKSKQMDLSALDPKLQDYASQIAADVGDRTQTQLLEAMVPDAYELSEEDEFGTWFKDQDEHVLNAFVQWDDEEVKGVRDATTLIKAYTAYKAHKAELQKKSDENADAINRSVADRAGGALPPTKQPMTEEEAFAARLAEYNG